MARWRDIVADDANDVRIFGSQSQFRCCEQPIDDVIWGADAIVDELGGAIRSYDKEWRHFVLCDRFRELDVYLLSIIEGPQRTPGHFVARNFVAELQLFELQARRQRPLGCALLLGDF